MKTSMAGAKHKTQKLRDHKAPLVLRLLKEVKNFPVDT